MSHNQKSCDDNLCNNFEYDCNFIVISKGDVMWAKKRNETEQLLFSLRHRSVVVDGEWMEFKWAWA